MNRKLYSLIGMFEKKSLKLIYLSLNDNGDKNNQTGQKNSIKNCLQAK